MSEPRRDHSEVERVREASDIVRVMGEHVALKPKGREYVGLCPFHDDHKPSMYVVPHKQIFHCFVCNATGNVFGFLMKFHGMEFREALEYLAERAGIELARWRPGPAEPASAGEPGVSKQDLLRANATAQDFFRAILAHAEHGRAARDLIARRQLAPDVVDRFQIGAAPSRWDGLLRTLESKGLGTAAFESLGLLKARDGGGGHYDALRHRLIFPIHDQGGRCIAFGGRRIDDADEPKYINSPDTRLFNKSRTLYGLHLASREIQRRGTAIVCEGYMDVVACHQAGVANAVGVLGTALTREHASVLRRLCHTIVLLFDGDEAGQRAADRSVEVLFGEELDVKIATLSSVTDAKDPDELLKREGGRELFERAVSSARDLMEYRYRRLAADLRDAGPAALARAVEADLSKLMDLGLMRVNPVRRQLILKRLSEITGVNAEAIVASRPAGRSGPRAAPGAEPVPAHPAADLARAPLSPEAHALGCVLCRPALWATLTDAQRGLIVEAEYASPLLGELARLIDRLGADGVEPALDAVLAEGAEGVQSAAIILSTRLERETEDRDERVASHLGECLARAQRDRRGPAADAGPDAPGGWESLQRQIEIKRQQHATLGGDRRVFPKPK